MKKVKNYARFYALLKKISAKDKQGTKEALVESFTKGRTSSLRDMTPNEYTAMCNSLDEKTKGTQQARATTAEIKAQRSAVLHRMQKLGVNTSDWNEVDKFCINNRIAGKVFFNLTVEELKGLIPKLIAMAKKPKARTPKKQSTAPEITDYQIQALIYSMPSDQPVC